MKSDKRILFAIITSLVLSLFVLLLVFEKQEADTPSLNQIRVLTNPIYSTLNQMPREEERTAYLASNEMDYRVILLNLEGLVYYDSESLLLGETVDINLFLYMDESYKNMNKGYIKLAFPLKSDGVVDGFVVFEVDSFDVLTYFNDDSSNQSRRMIIPLLMLLLIGQVFDIYRKSIQKKKELNRLKEAMNDLTKGVYKTLEEKTAYITLYSAYNQLVDELIFLRERHLSNEAARNTFLTQISHELKTPVATINAYVEALVSDVAENREDENYYKQVIREKMGQLTAQIETLFKYAQKSASRFKYNFTEIYANQVIDQLFNRIKMAQKKRVIVENKVTKCIVNMDSVRMEQVLLNLLNNALKHSDVTSMIRFLAYREDQKIVIEVSDEGSGISPSDMPYIFDDYYQGENAKESDYEGVGIGLSICKEIVEKHNGLIKVKSILGEGTTFKIILPIV